MIKKKNQPEGGAKAPFPSCLREGRKNLSIMRKKFLVYLWAAAVVVYPLAHLIGVIYYLFFV